MTTDALYVVQTVGFGFAFVMIGLAAMFAIGYFRSGTKYYKQHTVTRSIPEQNGRLKAGPPKASY